MTFELKPRVKKTFYAVTGTLFIVTLVNFFTQGITLVSLMLHNTLMFIVTLALLYNIYIRQEFINSKK